MLPAMTTGQETSWLDTVKNKAITFAFVVATNVAMQMVKDVITPEQPERDLQREEQERIQLYERYVELAPHIFMEKKLLLLTALQAAQCTDSPDEHQKS